MSRSDKRAALEEREAILKYMRSILSGITVEGAIEAGCPMEEVDDRLRAELYRTSSLISGMIGEISNGEHLDKEELETLS